MKVHNTIEELLEAHTKWVLKFYTLSEGDYGNDLDRAFIASNSLALEKPDLLPKHCVVQNRELLIAYEEWRSTKLFAGTDTQDRVKWYLEDN